MRVASTILGLLWACLLLACSAGQNAPPAPSCKLVPTPCSSLSYAGSLCDGVGVGCRLTYQCAGAASCAAALTSMGSQFPDLNCMQGSPGCTWTGSTCTGTPLPCSDPMYQQNSVACENVGCTLSYVCEGGDVGYDCGLQSTQTYCQQYPFCEWK